MPPTRFVVGVYVSEQNAGFLKLETTGSHAHFLTDEIEPKTHVWAKFENYWFSFHVFGIYDNQKAAKEALEEISRDIYKLDSEEQTTERRLYCCDLHSIPEDLRKIPPVPGCIEGKTEFDQPSTGIQPAPAPLEKPSVDPLPATAPSPSPPKKRPRKVHSAAIFAPKELIDRHRQKRKEHNKMTASHVPVVTSNGQDNMLLREILSAIHGLQQQVKAVDERCKQIEERSRETEERTRRWNNPMNEIATRFTNLQTRVSRVDLNMTALNLSDNTPLTPLQKGPSRGVKTSTPQSVRHERLRFESDDAQEGQESVETTVTHEPQAVQNESNLTNVTIEDESIEATVTHDIEKEPVKQFWCRFFLQNNKKIAAVRTETVRSNGSNQRMMLQAESKLEGGKFTYVGPMKVPTNIYNNAKKKGLHSYLRTLCKYFFSPCEMANSSIRGGKYHSSSQIDYGALEAARLSLLFRQAEIEFPNEFCHDTAFIDDRTKRTNALLGKSTCEALSSMRKIMRARNKTVPECDVETEFISEFGATLTENTKFILIDTPEPNCEEIVGLSIISIR